MASDEKSMSENAPACGVRLKRGHLSSASFNSRTGRSYMENILEMHPFEKKIAFDNSLHTCHLKMESSDVNISSPEIYEISVEDSINEFMKNERTPVLSPKGQVSELTADELAEDISKGGNLKSFPEQRSNFELDSSATFHMEGQKYEEVGGRSKPGASVDGFGSDDFETEEIPTTLHEEDCATDGKSTKLRVNRSRSDKLETERIPAVFHLVDRNDELLDGKLKPKVDTDSYMSVELEVEKTATTSHLVYQKDLLVDGESKKEANADGSRSDKFDVENIATTCYEVDEDTLVVDEAKKDGTVDVYNCDDFEVEKSSTILHPLDKEDEFVGGEGKRDGNALGYILVDFDVEKKHSTFDYDSRIQDVADGYRPHKFELEKVPSTINHLFRKGASVNDEIMEKVGTDGYRSDDASEMDNYMDALTTMESETETDTESRAKHELGVFNVVSHEMDSEINEERGLHGQCSDTHSIGGSSTMFGSNGSFKKERSSYSSDSLSNLADGQSPKGNGATSLNMSGNFQNSFRSKDAIARPMPDNSCFGPSVKSSYSTDADMKTEIFLAEVRDVSSELHTDNGDILKTKLLDCIAPIETGNEESDFYRKDLVSILIHPSPSASLNEGQLARSDLTEVSSTYVEDSTEEMNKDSDNDLQHVLEISGLKLQIREMPLTEFSESCPVKSLIGKIHDPPLHSLSNSSDFTDMTGGTKDNDVLEVLAIGGTTKCSSDYLQANEVLDPPSETVHDSTLELVPTGCMEDYTSAAENVRNRMLWGTKGNDVLEVLATGVTTECSSDYLESTEVCDPPTNAIHESTLGLVPTGYVEDCSSVAESVMNRKLDSSNSTTTSVEKRLCISTEQDQDPFDAFLDGKLPREKIESLSTTLELEEKDKPLPEGIHPNSLILMGNTSKVVDLPSLSVVSNALLHKLTNENHTESDALVSWCCLGATVCNDCSHESIGSPVDTSEDVNFPSVSVASNAPLHNLTNEDHAPSGCFLRATSSNDSSPEPSCSLEVSVNHIQLQDEYLSESASNLYELKINESPNHESQLESDAQKIHTVAHSENDEALPESTLLDSAESPAYLHHFAPLKGRQTQVQVMNDPEGQVSLSLSDQESELKSREDNQHSALKSDHSYPHEGAKPTDSLEGVELEAVNQNSVPAPHEEEAHCEYFDALIQKAGMDPQHDLQQPSEHEKQIDSHAVDTILINGFNTSSSPITISTSMDPEACIPLQLAPSLEISESPLSPYSSNVASTTSPIIPSFRMHAPDTTNQGSSEAEECTSLQPDHTRQSSELPSTSSSSCVPSISTPVAPSFGLFASESTHHGTLKPELSRSLTFPFPISNVAPTNLEDMPPLPPLPPLEWRMGKVRYASPTLGGEIEPSLDSISPLLTIKDVKSCHGSLPQEGGISWPSNPFAPLPTIEDEKPSNSLVQLPTVGGEKPSLALEEQILQPPSFSTPLSVAENENDHVMLTLEGTRQQPLGPFSQLQTEEDEKPQDNLHLGPQPNDPLIVGGEKPSLGLERETPQPPSSSMLLPVVEDDNSFNVMPTSVGVIKQPLNPFLQLQTVDDEKLEGNLHLGPNQPKDPLIEAIASHDRSMVWMFYYLGIS